MVALSVVAGLVFALSPLAAARHCLGFDDSFNLYVFGAGSRDLALGPQSAWTGSSISGNALTITGRPPFNGNNTQCFLSQFYNALYVLNADSNIPGFIHIFSFATQSWTTQIVDLNGVNPTSIVAILDRDTNVLFGLDRGRLYELNMGELSAASPNNRRWEPVGSPDFAQNGAYPNPVMALARNHIHFLNTGTPGQAAVFVIHFAYFQPERQLYAPVEGSSGGTFPSQHGQTVSVFRSVFEVQQQFAFIPDDGRQTYVVDVRSNTTSIMPAPPVKGTGSTYAAGQNVLVQLGENGELHYIPFDPENVGANAAARWTRIAVTGLGTGSSTNTLSGTTSSPTGTETSPPSEGNNSSLQLSFGWAKALAILGIACILI